jgi:hypothetical protein
MPASNDRLVEYRTVNDKAQPDFARLAFFLLRCLERAEKTTAAFMAEADAVAGL